MSKQKISIVWFKRDLRLQDHAPLKHAIEAGLPIVLLYCIEPSLCQAAEVSERHSRFVLESIDDLNRQLKRVAARVSILHAEVKDVFQFLYDKYSIQTIYSTRETGLLITFERDLSIKKWCQEKNILWKEYRWNGVIRGLRNRDFWAARYDDWLSKPLAHPDLHSLKTINDIAWPNKWLELPNIASRPNGMQQGGESFAHRYLQSFFRNRYESYSYHISKPEYSRKSCSRLSPYLAYGCLSIRQIIKQLEAVYPSAAKKRQLIMFRSRLYWQSHFIQKFESEHRMQFVNQNAAYNSIRQDENDDLISAWCQGETGIPLVDASMKCLIETGYINFRMRAMLISVLAHTFWQPWQRGAQFLARQFLDFEAGIHYPQVQMQAGTTGTSTVRIYNPVKQAQDHDPEAHFIKKWLPELKSLPPALAHQPWLMTPLDESYFNLKLDKHYPRPRVNLVEAHRHARKVIHEIKKSPLARQESRRILDRHVDRRNRMVNTLKRTT